MPLGHKRQRAAHAAHAGLCHRGVLQVLDGKAPDSMQLDGIRGFTSLHSYELLNAALQPEHLDPGAHVFGGVVGRHGLSRLPVHIRAEEHVQALVDLSEPVLALDAGE